MPGIVPGDAQGLVSDLVFQTVLFPRSAVLADRDDHGGLAVDDGGVASVGVVGAVGGGSADPLTFG